MYIPTKYGRILYVSQGGNDDSAEVQSIQRPYRTISRAVSAATSGDTIYVFPGTYGSEGDIYKDGITMYCEPNVLLDEGTYWTGTASSTYSLLGHADINSNTDALNPFDLDDCSNSNIILEFNTFRVKSVRALRIQNTGTFNTSLTIRGRKVETLGPAIGLTFCIYGSSGATLEDVNVSIDIDEFINVGSTEGILYDFRGVEDSHINASVGKVYNAFGGIRVYMCFWGGMTNSIVNIKAGSIYNIVPSGTIRNLFFLEYSQNAQNSFGPAASTNQVVNIDVDSIYTNGALIGNPAYGTGSTQSMTNIKVGSMFFEDTFGAGQEPFGSLIQDDVSSTFNDSDVGVNIHVDNMISIDKPLLDGNLGNIYLKVSGSYRVYGTGVEAISAIPPNANTEITLADMYVFQEDTTVPILEASAARNVTIRNVKTNVLTTDADVSEVGEPIVRDSNYK